MEDFQKELISRLPLAVAVWTALRHIVTDELAAELFEEHRGTGREGKIPFATLVELVGDALLEHHGSGRKSFQRAVADGRLLATPRAAYDKLGRLRITLSQALLAQATERLAELLPPANPSPLPVELSRFEVVVLDGKKLKNFPKRMRPLRGASGKLLGGKVAVALRLRDGLAVAIEPALDGEANDAPLAAPLIEQVRQGDGPFLFVADRQYCDLSIPPPIVQGGDHFLIRYSKKMRFSAERCVESRDAEGRPVIEEWGWLGRPEDKRRFRTRRVTLVRAPQEDVSVLTDLVDEHETPAAAVLALYLERWTIERVFQQMSEVFCLEQLMGSTPQGAIFQFAFCLLIYNVLEMVRAWVAHDLRCSPRRLSSEMLFRDLRDEMTIQFRLGGQAELLAALPSLSASAAAERIATLLKGLWSPLWLKAPKHRRGPPSPPRLLRGGHASAWKLIQEARARR